MAKILFVIESLHLGGAEKSLVTLLNKVDLTNHKVELWVNAKGGALEADLPKNISVKQIPRRKANILERGYYFILRSLRSSKNFNSSQLIWRSFKNTYLSPPDQFDIAIAYHQGLPTYYILEKINAKRKIGWMNTDYIAAGYNRSFDLPVFQKLDKIVAASGYAKSTLVNSFPQLSLEPKITVVEDFIDRINILKLADEHTEIEKYSGTKIVTVGRLNVTKGYPLAVEAARILKEQGYDFKWFIVGEGDQRTAISKLITDNDLTNNVLLLGAQPNPYPYMRAADIYVQTSILEGFSISVREAKILKKPIVCTNFPSMNDALEDGVNALIAEMNGESIADKIAMLLENKSLQQKFVKSLSEEHYNQSKSYEEQIVKIIENKI